LRWKGEDVSENGNGTRKPNLSTEVIYADLQKRLRRIEDRLDDEGKVELDAVLWALAVETFGDLVREELFPMAGADKSAAMVGISNEVCTDLVALENFRKVAAENSASLALEYHDQTGTK
jgi:hypothetical protein